MKATIVFQKIWDAIHATNEDGSRKYKYILLPETSRSSKTYSCIDIYHTYCRAYENKRCTVWRDTKTDCKKTVLFDTTRHLRLTGRWGELSNFNKTESILEYSTSSTFEIHGTDDEDTVHGLTQDAAWLNEPYNISKEVFDQIDQRTSDFMLIDYNPKKSMFTDDLQKDSRCIVIHSTFADNPFCPDEQRRKILSYQPVSMCRVVTEKILTIAEAMEYDCKKNLLNISPGRITELLRCRENEFKNSAHEFNWSVYGLGLKAERPNRIFRFSEIPESEYFNLSVPVYYGVDWGAVDPWGIIEAKYYDGGLYLHELNYASENEIRSRLTTTEQAQINASDEGIVRWLFNKINVKKSAYIICDSNRPTKIIALREAGWDYAMAAPKGPGSIIDGIDLLNNLKVYYTSTSVNIKYEQENYSRKIDRQGNILEEPEDLDNHTIDPTRYVGLFLQSEGIINAI